MVKEESRNDSQVHIQLIVLDNKQTLSRVIIVVNSFTNHSSSRGVIVPHKTVAVIFRILQQIATLYCTRALCVQLKNIIQTTVSVNPFPCVAGIFIQPISSRAVPTLCHVLYMLHHE